MARVYFSAKIEDVGYILTQSEKIEIQNIYIYIKEVKNIGTLSFKDKSADGKIFEWKNISADGVIGYLPISEDVLNVPLSQTLYSPITRSNTGNDDLYLFIIPQANVAVKAVVQYKHTKKETHGDNSVAESQEVLFAATNWEEGKTYNYKFKIKPSDDNIITDNLPEGYIRLEYIQSFNSGGSDNRSYVDLNTIANTDHFGMEAEVMYISGDKETQFNTTHDTYPAGSNVLTEDMKWTQRFYLPGMYAMYGSNEWRIGWNDIYSEGGKLGDIKQMDYNQKVVISLNFLNDGKAKMKFKGNVGSTDKVIDVIGDFKASPSSIHLFGRNEYKILTERNIHLNWYGRIYSVKGSLGSMLYMKLFPCIESATNKLGMYDVISKSFYECVGKGFLSGPYYVETNELSEGSQINKPNNTGTVIVE